MALSGFLNDSDSDFLVDSDTDHLDDSDLLQVDSEKQTCIPSTGLHQPTTIYKQTNPFNYIFIVLENDVRVNLTGSVVEMMQHLKIGIRWSAYRSPLLPSWF